MLPSLFTIYIEVVFFYFEENKKAINVYLSLLLLNNSDIN